eukprot:gene2890-biopygen2377
MSTPKAFAEFLKKRAAEREAEDNDREKDTHITPFKIIHDTELEEDSQLDEHLSQAVVPPAPQAKAATSKRRGRPAKKVETEWTDDDIFRLIDLWGTKENLYNVQHPRYHNRDTRQKSLEGILTSMKSEGAAITTTKQLQEKMKSLRSYFGAERRKTESSRRSGTGTDNVYISAWKFYSYLEFLQDGLTPRETVSNIETEVPAEVPNESCTYEVNRPPSAKTARKMKQKSVEAAEKVMEGAAQALQKLSDIRKQRTEERYDEDRCFTDMILQMLRTIPDSEAKAMLKVEFQ